MPLMAFLPGRRIAQRGLCYGNMSVCHTRYCV